MSKSNEAIEGEIVEELSDEEKKKALRKAHLKKKLTVKERKFINEFVKNGGNATQAALAACDVTTYGGAVQSGRYMKNKLADHIEAAMMKYGLDDETAMTRHKELIQSENEAVAMKAVDTWYKFRFKNQDNDKDQTVNVQINF